MPISLRGTPTTGSSHKVTKLEGHSPVGGQGRGQGRRSQGCPCGFIMWGLGCFSCKESQKGVGCLTLPQRTAEPRVP